jgi:molybdopterin-binding protein
MKKLLGTDLTGSYTFNPAANTITFSGLRQDISLENILLITNTTANTIIYNFADSTTGAVSFNNNVLTLDYNTSAMSSTDKLQIYVDVESYEESLHDLLRRMNKLLESNAVVDNRLRQRVTIDAIGNSTAGSSPTEVTTTIPVSGTVTASISNTVGSNVTLSTGANDIQYVQSTQVSPYATTSNTTFMRTVNGFIDERWRIADDARNTYANTIRRNLVFS